MIFLNYYKGEKMFETFDNKADVGVRGKGKSIEQAFEGCAKALTSIMADIDSIEPKKAHVLEVKANDYGALLVSFLNELLFLKDTKKIIYSKFRAKILKEKNSEGKEIFVLKATIFGEKIDSKKHLLKVDPKAATYSQLSVEKKENEWIAQCIIDV
jgi:SHS2 domain-containing protein